MNEWESSDWTHNQNYDPKLSLHFNKIKKIVRKKNYKMLSSMLIFSKTLQIDRYHNTATKSQRPHKAQKE